MALAQNRLVAGLWGKLRTKVGVRFTRFVIVAGVSLFATEVALTVCNGVFHMTATPAALISWFVGAVTSYVLSRWAWERKGKPDVLRETIPFWVISAMVIVVLTLATKFAYHSASWMGLTGAKHVLWVDFVWLVANFCTFLLRFVIFHYVLFAERTTAARAAATGPDTIPPGTPETTTASEAPHSAAPAATAEATAEATVSNERAPDGRAAAGIRRLVKATPDAARPATNGDSAQATAANGACAKPASNDDPANAPATEPAANGELA